MPGMRGSPIRSCWMRSITTASAPSTASRSLQDTVAPSASMPAGIIVGGPQSRTRAPSFVIAWRSERATREWLMSPTIATVFPSSVPSFSRSVKQSSSPWLGCSCAPSPADTTEQPT